MIFHYVKDWEIMVWQSVQDYQKAPSLIILELGSLSGNQTNKMKWRFFNKYE